MNRSSATSIEFIEKAALEVFAERGFEDTTVEEVAAAAGISRRTFFRYFASKNDIPFGNHAGLMADMDDWLAAAPDDRGIFELIAEAVMRFNRIHTDGPVAHRERMRLIIHTPALRASYALRMAESRAVLARFAARRLGEPMDSYRPQLVAYLSHAAGLAAYEEWLRDEAADLVELTRRGFAMLAQLPELTATTDVGRPRPTAAGHVAQRVERSTAGTD